jgi:hypothetical protein
MPRYRVVLEFDHPGDGVPVGDHSTTRAPQHWIFPRFLDSDATNLTAEVYEERTAFVLVDDHKENR